MKRLGLVMGLTLLPFFGFTQSMLINVIDFADTNGFTFTFNLKEIADLPPFIFESSGGVVFLPIGEPGSGVSYVTGSASPAPRGVSGSAANIRSRSFEGADYFTSSASGIDTAFPLQLGNGVKPQSFPAAQIEAVPEPGSAALGVFAGILAWAVGRHRRRTFTSTPRY